jgi:hypothetical protein
MSPRGVRLHLELRHVAGAGASSSRARDLTAGEAATPRGVGTRRGDRDEGASPVAARNTRKAKRDLRAGAEGAPSGRAQWPIRCPPRSKIAKSTLAKNREQGRPSTCRRTVVATPSTIPIETASCPRAQVGSDSPVSGPVVVPRDVVGDVVSVAGLSASEERIASTLATTSNATTPPMTSHVSRVRTISTTPRLEQLPPPATMTQGGERGRVAAGT